MLRSYFYSSSIPGDSNSPGPWIEAIFVLPQVSPGTLTPQANDGSYFVRTVAVGYGGSRVVGSAHYPRATDTVGAGVRSQLGEDAVAA
jgi:hypothetical protein